MKSRKMIEYLAQNEKWLTLVVSIVVGFSSIIATCVNAYLVCRQNKIAEEQATMQRNLNQPIFRVLTHLERDLDDGKFGSESLTIRNVGMQTLNPCHVDVRVFFRFTSSNGKERDSVFVEAYNYFTYACYGNTGDSEVYSASGPGNNRKYAQLYQEAIQDGKDGKDRVYYFLDKLILTRIEYEDIHADKHIVCFCNSTSLREDDYNRIVNHGEKCPVLPSLDRLTYSDLKKALLANK